MTLNLSQVFVKYPDVLGAADAVRAMLTPLAKSGRDVPRHVVVATGTPWVGVFAAGNSAPPELAEYLSRALEAHALWFGLAGRALAYRVRRFHLGRRTTEATVPPELFAEPDPFPLPAYVDVEQTVFDLLVEEAMPRPYLFVHAEELGAEAHEREADAVAIAAAPWSEAGLEVAPFVHRLPRRDHKKVRTLFDTFDEEKRVVADEVVLRGAFEEPRAMALLALLQAMAKRRHVPDGWKYVYLLDTAAGPALLKPLGELFAREKATLAPAYELALG